ncbi:hypothetical protein [Glutamicibacter sp. NPDC087344]|uniref:hypothetical protein n=1 Tax=Glutamicibacter sp. NPDC087344 TaxID=3363994 RepID=UPI0037F541FC
MPRRTIHGIDPYAPGGIEELLNFHRQRWGDAQMNANAGDGGEGSEDGVEQGNQQTGEQPGSQGQPSPKPAEAQKGDEWDGKVESLPQGAQKIINDLRKAEGDERVSKKVLDQIAKVLNPDAKGDEKPTAEQLTKQLAERDTATNQAQTELAVYRLAGKAGADADALLDSRAFLAKLADIDHTDTAKVTKAITDAITENPKLKSGRVPGSSAADGAGGSGEQRTKKSMSLTEATASHYGTK